MRLRVAKDLELPLDAVTQKLAFLGRTGSGKTYGAKRMVEQMLRAGAQVVVLDPVGVWAGLRLGPKAFELPVLGGLFGDIPLEPMAGAVIADLVVGRGTSMVLDVSQMLDAERTRFAQAFGERFFQRKKAEPGAVHVVLEECQEFVPQNPQGGEERMLHEWQRIAKLGRNFGIGVSFISQRPQEVNKKALNQAECVFAFQLTGPQERKALQYWLSDRGADEKLADVLPTLKVGSPHVWSPQWLKISKVVSILPIETLDTSQTPKVGEKSFKQQKLEPLDLAELKAEMAATIERAKADDPKMLRARIAELERQLKTATPEQEIVEVPAFDEASFNELFQQISTAVDGAAARASEAKSEIGRLLVSYRGSVRGRQPAVPAGKPRVKPEPAQHLVTGATMPSGERRILTAIMQSGGRATKRKVALLAGYAVSGGGFNNLLSALRGKGWIVGSSELEATDAGRKALGSWGTLPTGAEAVAYWVGQLGKAEGLILQALARARGRALSKAAVAEAAGYEATGGGFNNALSRLRTLELIEGSGELRIAEELQ